MASIWMEGLEGRRFFSVSVLSINTFVPIDLIPIDMGNGGTDGSSTDNSGGDNNNTDGGSTDSGSTDGSGDSTVDPTTDPVVTDGNIETFGLSALGSVRSSVKKTRTHQPRAKKTHPHAGVTKVKHPFNVHAKIGAHTRASFLKRGK